VEETNLALMPDDLAQLCKRARRVRAEAQQLSADYHFIISWYQMRPGSSTRLDRLLDDDPCTAPISPRPPSTPHVVSRIRAGRFR
jgi:hypothetical protein